MDKGLFKILFKLFLYLLAAMLVIFGIYLISNIDPRYVKVLTWSILGVAVLALAIIIVMFVTSHRHGKKLEMLADILYLKCEPERYIEETTKAIEKATGRNYKANLIIYLAIGYQAMGEYDRAIETIKGIKKIDSYNKVIKAIYYCNLSCFYVLSGKISAGLKSFKDGEKAVKKSQKMLQSGYVSLIKGILLFEDGDIKQAEHCLREAKKEGFENNKHMPYLTDAYLAAVAIKKGDTESGKKALQRIQQKKTLPFIILKAEELSK